MVKFRNPGIVYITYLKNKSSESDMAGMLCKHFRDVDGKGTKEGTYIILE